MPEDARAPAPGYRIEDLAHRSGSTVRTIRAYQDRGLLPKPERRGRANVYGERHLARLQQITGLLDRGYSLASIKELLDAWDSGRGLGGVLGLVAEVHGPWTDEQAARLTRAELAERFGGDVDDIALAEAIELGVLEPEPGHEDTYRVPSPAELAVAAELHTAGVPLTAVADQLRELRTQMERIAGRFVDFTTEHVFRQHLDLRHPPSDTEAAEAAALVRRLRPLAQRTVVAELARAMRLLATRYLRGHLHDRTHDRTEAPGPRRPKPQEAPPARAPVPLPVETLEAVRALVGRADAPAFIAAAAEREVKARTMDALAERHGDPKSAPAAGNSAPARRNSDAARRNSDAAPP